MLGGFGLEKLGHEFGHNFFALSPNPSKFFIAELKRLRAIDWYNTCPVYFNVEGVKRESRTFFEKSLARVHGHSGPGFEDNPVNAYTIR